MNCVCANVIVNSEWSVVNQEMEINMTYTPLINDEKADKNHFSTGVRRNSR
jgi:hypothetical protein